MIDTFKSITKDIYDHKNPNRILNESDYFEAYLNFLDNSIYYSRFSFTINGITIKGKYLNEKVTKWANRNIFNMIYKKISETYIDRSYKTKKIVSIDSQFIRNRLMPTKSKIIGRNKYYKNKRGTKLTVIVDEKGLPLTLSLDNGCKYDSKICLKECNKLIKSGENKKCNKMYLLADSGYDSHSNKQFLIDNRIEPVIKWNRKNTKDKKIIKRNKFTKDNSRKLFFNILERYY